VLKQKATNSVKNLGLIYDSDERGRKKRSQIACGMRLVKLPFLSVDTVLFYLELLGSNEKKKNTGNGHAIRDRFHNVSFRLSVNWKQIELIDISQQFNRFTFNNSIFESYQNSL